MMEHLCQFFTIPTHLYKSEQMSLTYCLKTCIDVFATNELSNLGYTDLIKIKIVLKPDNNSKNQLSYRLTTNKKEVLRDHLDKLLEQGLIAPVVETDEVTFTSPVVLVLKRSYNKSSSAASQYRFCCDFRYLHSQTSEFRYAISDLQDLPESF